MSNSKLYDRSCCIICQNPDEKDDLTRVEFKSTGERTLKVSEKLQDKSFFRRLNSITNAKGAVANEVVYHNPCWVKAKREAVPTVCPTESFARTLSDIEIINSIETHLREHSQTFLDMNTITVCNTSRSCKYLY